ncbi:bifunctional hydroxymethylpyrimidine kinase/phosphomethylpyrimidine kinase [Vagococcus vulneris]|uniref:pyridoxal kinase n=1 Tax=Vagococcus vulneris TaxID=1977869 RepID=A0A429ZZC2_9ENTE|nr:bifunctional hydroxymethylpyrimidine kinase/phosphomethylpyrimidine kinase [Vagococcus vulneris]RST99367.1 bifunctional hydroxymethylpyrimidine kinase/phosphomethylpyrimidine kinase [Vagococcus vulneris]
MLKKVLSIAGSDAGGGAGIQADIKTFEEYGLFGISSITSILTVDPSTQSADIYPIPRDIVEKQLATAFSGGALDAVKLGLLGSLTNIELIEDYIVRNSQHHLVLDPVMAVKTNDTVLQPEIVSSMIKKLIPLSDIITPNLVETKILANMPKIETKQQMMTAAENIFSLGPKIVVIKGGARFPGYEALDLFFDGRSFEFLTGPKINSQTNHGAGCSFAAAITAGIAKGLQPLDAVKLAKKYVTCAIEHGLYLNDFTGYVWHGAFQNAQQRMIGEINYEN